MQSFIIFPALVRLNFSIFLFLQLAFHKVFNCDHIQKQSNQYFYYKQGTEDLQHDSTQNLEPKIFKDAISYSYRISMTTS